MSEEISTERLILRQPGTKNFEALYALTEPEEMRTFLGSFTPSRADSFARMLRNAGMWSLYGYGIFMVHEAATDIFVGTCGLFPSYRGLGDDFDNLPEAGWIIGQDHWGRGYAGEAMTAAVGWFDETQGRQRTVCMIDPGNTASAKVAAKLGYRLYATRNFMDTPTNLFERI